MGTRVSEYYYDEWSLKERKYALWLLAWGQTSDLIRTKIKLDTEFLNQEKDKGYVWLLKAIKSVANKIEDTKHPLFTIIETRKQLWKCKKIQMKTFWNVQSNCRPFTKPIEKLTQILESVQGLHSSTSM